MSSKHETITAGMVDREELAREIEREIKPQLDKPGSLNALGAYMLIMKIVEGK